MKKRILTNLFCVLIILISINFIINVNAAPSHLVPAPIGEVQSDANQKLNQGVIDNLANNMKTIEKIEDKSKFWKSFIESNKQTEAWNQLTPEEKRNFLKIIAKEQNINLNEINGLDSELTWEGSKLKTKNGAYLDFENIPPWITKADYSEDKLTIKLDTQLSGNKDNERTIILEGKGTITNEGVLEITDVSNKNGGNSGIRSVPKINLAYGEGGTITIRTNNEISLLGGANLKINNDFYKQFYSENSEWYKPEDGGDEEAVVKIIQIQKTTPSDSKYFPEAKNTIVSIPNEDGAVLGEFYTSRRQGIKIMNTREIGFDPFNSQTEYYNPYERYEPFIEINLKNKNEMNVKIVGDYYMGLVLEEKTKINDMYLSGKGSIAKGQEEGQYIYVRNGDFKTSVKEGETYVSGNSKKAIASIERMRNGLDSNPNNELTIARNGEYSTIRTKDAVVSINIPTDKNWNPSERLAGLKGRVKEIETIAKENPKRNPRLTQVSTTPSPETVSNEDKPQEETINPLSFPYLFN